jgi:hypothetical protein
MAKYLVTGLVDATVSVHVDADSPEDAAAAGWNHPRFHASLCHQCARVVQVGDISGTMVIADDGAGDVVYDDSQSATLTRQLDRLREAAEALVHPETGFWTKCHALTFDEKVKRQSELRMNLDRALADLRGDA